MVLGVGRREDGGEISYVRVDRYLHTPRAQAFLVRATRVCVACCCEGRTEVLTRMKNSQPTRIMCEPPPLTLGTWPASNKLAIEPQMAVKTPLGVLGSEFTKKLTTDIATAMPKIAAHNTSVTCEHVHA